MARKICEFFVKREFWLGGLRCRRKILKLQHKEIDEWLEKLFNPKN